MTMYSDFWPQSLRIRSRMFDYDVVFWKAIGDGLARLGREDSLFFVVDRNVMALYPEELSAISGRGPCFLVDAQESTKTMDGVGRLVTWLQEQGAHKKSVLVAIGGGIIQDLSAFTAHVFYRGIKWIFFPTTLLSMCDSCIGAKCGINHSNFKNQLGVFHAPAEVHIVPQFLNTLSAADVRSGFGEILKLMLTGSWDDFLSLEDATAEGLDTPQLPRLIRRSLEIKQGVIEADEYEADLRRILNYGHTFGHALETLSDFAVPHGVAVCWGIDAANYIAVRRQLLSNGTAERIRALIRSRMLGRVEGTRPTAEALLACARKDKKAFVGGLNLILLNSEPYGLRVVSQPHGEEILEWLSVYLREHDALFSS